MNNRSPSTQRPVFYKILFVLMIPALIYFVALIVDLFVQPVPTDTLAKHPLFALIIGLLVAPGTVLVGLLVIQRVPGNVIGLFLVFIGMVIANTVLKNTHSVTQQLFSAPFNQLSFRFFFLLPFFFPTGRAYPLRFEKWVIFCWGISLVAGIVGIFTSPEIGFESNVLFIPTLALLKPLFNSVAVVTTFFLAIGSFVSIFLRYRAAETIERLQLKWLVWGFSIVVLISLTWTRLHSIFQLSYDHAYYLFAQTYVYAFPALTIGNAILRYRLYDIDIIIRRTLIYSAITALLAGVYFGGVALMQSVFVSITGQQSPLAVVASTLIIAALFAPLRRRVQDFVDRRFYRQKYDAQKTLEAFAVTMRDEVDMETLKAQLVSVVNDTMKPTSISLWVRED